MSRWEGQRIGFPELDEFGGGFTDPIFCGLPLKTFEEVEILKKNFLRHGQRTALSSISVTINRNIFRTSLGPLFWLSITFQKLGFVTGAPRAIHYLVLRSEVSRRHQLGVRKKDAECR